MNNLCIDGRLTRDVEIKTTANQKIIGKFGIAQNDSYDKEKAHFFNVVSFGKTAENIGKFFKKGDQIFLTGSISYSSWKDKDGNNRNSIDIIANGFTFCGSKKVDNQSAQQSQAVDPFNVPPEIPPFQNSEVPF